MRFHDFYREMAQMVDKFVNIPNRVLLYQLYNYISDMRSVTSMVNSHIKWHGEFFKSKNTWPRKIRFWPVSEPIFASKLVSFKNDIVYSYFTVCLRRNG